MVHPGKRVISVSRSCVTAGIGCNILVGPLASYYFVRQPISQ
jgi:hypothetical protein